MLGTNKYEIAFNENAETTISRMSDIGGGSNPEGNTAATLFYQGAKNNPNRDKYGKYLFYGIGRYARGDGSGYLNEEANSAYYLSENRAYNRNVSNYLSKNPSARNLVNLSVKSTQSPLDGNFPIIGGTSAPYNWSDFLFCKHYGKIPNNYMVTLRRFPTPMLDNLSLPKVVKETDLHKLEGAGKPVAQAVTWFGAGTGNSLDSIISFSTGLEWQYKTASSIIRQKGMDTGFFKSVLGLIGANIEEAILGTDTITQGMIATTSLISTATKEGEREITEAKMNYANRETASNIEDGPLSDHIFTSVDVINGTYFRSTGIKFNSDIRLKFHYELTSIGQVNTKASFLDLFANLLSLGTNYGTFIRPDIRFDNEFPAILFPGGKDGLMNFYASPVTFLTSFFSKVTENYEANTANISNIKQGDDSLLDKNNQLDLKADLGNIMKDLDINDIKSIQTADRAVRSYLSSNFLNNLQLNLSYFTGAPIGEWHLVVGNPLNPIAMIGNLICDSVEFRFGDKLGPDDFPTEMTVEFQLKHARGRDKGEIESMFNRGRGRLYQSTLKVSSSSVSEGLKADIMTNELIGSNALNQTLEQTNTKITN